MVCLFLFRGVVGPSRTRLQKAPETAIASDTSRVDGSSLASFSSIALRVLERVSQVLETPRLGTQFCGHHLDPIPQFKATAKLGEFLESGSEFGHAAHFFHYGLVGLSSSTGTCGSQGAAVHAKAHGCWE